MNIKGYKKIYAIIGLVLYLCTYGSLVVSAQTLPDYTVLAPLPGTTKDCNQNDPNANCTTNFKTYLEGMFKLLIGVSAILAFVMLVYAGFLYTTSEGMGQTTNARSKIEDAIWGLILVIGAYAILNTINPKILEFNLSIKRPEIEEVSPGDTPVKYGNGKVLPGYKLNEAQVTENGQISSILKNAQVFVNAGPCTDGGTSGCTNLVGLPNIAIDGLKQLYQDCNKCYVQVTGGTEGGHVEHGPNIPVVDLNNSSSLQSFLVGDKTPTNWQSVPKIINGQKVIFRYETTGSGPHWHVVF
jgi:hypothetical protein